MGRGNDNYVKEQNDRAIKQGVSKEIIDKMKGYTGVLAVLDTKVEGPTIAFRFDIDANDVIESTEEDHRPYVEGYCSVNKGMMHACGHDGHVAIGLGLAHTIIRY